MPTIIELYEEDPSVRPLLTKIRDEGTPAKDFRVLLQLYGMIAALKVLSLEEQKPRKVRTGNNADYMGRDFMEDGFSLLPVLRAAEAMSIGMQETFGRYDVPISIGYLGIKRVEPEGGKAYKRVDGKDTWNFKYESTYSKIPRYPNVLIMDPMNASGGTLKEATEQVLKEIKPKRLYYISLIDAKYGFDELLAYLKARLPPELYESCVIIAGQIDRGGINGSGLDERGYIVPGLGDAGDRSHGTPPV